MNDDGTNNKKTIWGFCGLWHYLVCCICRPLTSWHTAICAFSLQKQSEWIMGQTTGRRCGFFGGLWCYLACCVCRPLTWSCASWRCCRPHRTSRCCSPSCLMPSSAVGVRVCNGWWSSAFIPRRMNWGQSECGYTFLKILYTCSALESLSFMKLGIIEGDAKVLREHQV